MPLEWSKTHSTKTVFYSSTIPFFTVTYYMLSKSGPVLALVHRSRGGARLLSSRLTGELRRRGSVADYGRFLRVPVRAAQVQTAAGIVTAIDGVTPSIVVVTVVIVFIVMVDGVGNDLGTRPSSDRHASERSW